MTLWGLDTINRMRALPPKTDRTLGMDHKGVCVCVCVCVNEPERKYVLVCLPSCCFQDGGKTRRARGGEGTHGLPYLPVHKYAPTACYRRCTLVPFTQVANLQTSPIIRPPLYAISHPTNSRVVERRVVRRSPRVVLGNGRTARRKVYNMHPLLVALARVITSTRFRITQCLVSYTCVERYLSPITNALLAHPHLAPLLQVPPTPPAVFKPGIYGPPLKERISFNATVS